MTEEDKSAAASRIEHVLDQLSYTENNADLVFNSRRSPVMARNGMVACSQPLAAEIGLSTLKSGGNAVDAAIAIAAALNVTEPCSTGLGGDCFILYYDSKLKTVQAMNGSGRAPQSLNAAKIRADCPGCGDGIPKVHAHSVTVPGAAAGWADAVAKWGKLPLAQVLEPAAKLAEEGFPVHPICQYSWKKSEKLLQRNANPGLLVPDENASANSDSSLPGAAFRAPGVGEIFRNGALASVLRELGAKGKTAGFYQGRAGSVRSMQHINSPLHVRILTHTTIRDTM
jgi:gamma-glutamyltranspeptidase/glutathione hydrolase